MSIVYLNGEYLRKEEARIPVEDRGFLLADGVYEVTPAYAGVPFLMERHLARLARGLAALRIDFDAGSVAAVHEELLDRNGLRGEEMATVYLQVTRGVAPRVHHFPPEPVAPTVFASAKLFARPERTRWEAGYTAVTVPDRRWSRVDIKSIALVANVLAQQAAVDAGVDDVIQVRDGVALEGAHSNLFAVLGDTLVTAPANNYILHGITRGYLLELAAELAIPVAERPIGLEELAGAREVFFSGTSTEVRPVVAVDGRAVGDGVPGPVARRLYETFEARVLGRNAARGAA